MTRLDDIEKRWAKATPGPWKSAWEDPGAPENLTKENYDEHYIVKSESTGAKVIDAFWYDGPLTGCTREDCAAIASAPSDIQFLLARVRELEAGLAEACDGWDETLSYKMEFLVNKHGDRDDLARLRSLLPKAGEG